MTQSAENTGSEPRNKVYDRKYFDYWYRSGDAVISRQLVERKVRLAVAAAEFLLSREIRSVLDVGCGEASWRAVLRRMRPDVEYVGIDSSEYVVKRYGSRRNIRKGDVGSLGRMGLRRKFDLVVCADVLSYVPTPDVRHGLQAMRRLCRGLAYIEAYAVSDEVVGDLENWHYRSEAAFKKLFADAGFVQCGLNCWVPREQAKLLGAMEHC